MSSAAPITGGKITSLGGTMVYPYRISLRKLQQRLNPGQYIAPPSGATVVPRIPYVKPEWEEASEKLDRMRSNNFRDEDHVQQQNNNSNSSSNIDVDALTQRKMIPPFVAGEGDRSLVHQRNDAATKLPVKPLKKKLLPYKIRRTACMSLLHGGTRTTGLNMPYPELAITHSEQLALPTLKEERRDLGWDAADFALNLMPVNMHHEFKQQAWMNRNVDLWRRIQKEMKNCEKKVYLENANRSNSSNNSNSNSKKGMIFKSKNIRYTQPHSSQLRVEPYTNDEWQQIRADSAEARAHSGGRNVVIFDNETGQEREIWIENTPAAYTQKDAYLPFQSLKPHGYGIWNYSARNGAPIMAGMDLKQERLNRKGFGWKAIQNKLWQQDMDTARYQPDKGYLMHAQ